MTAEPLHPFGLHVAEAPNAHVLLGFIIGNHAFHHDLASGHIEPAPLVDDVDRQQCPVPLGFGDRCKCSGERQEDADFYLVGLGGAGRAMTKNAAEHENRK